jgi:hypothetical protein
MNDQLKHLIETDEKVISTKHFKVLRKDNDPDHYERRQQQRAISEEMVSLCLTYGEKKRIRGALTFTILDKNLKSTKYSKYLSELRGLRVVLNTLAMESSEIGIHTVYWVDEVKKK